MGAAALSGGGSSVSSGAVSADDDWTALAKAGVPRSVQAGGALGGNTLDGATLDGGTLDDGSVLPSPTALR